MLNREYSSSGVVASLKTAYINNVLMDFVVFGLKKGQLYTLVAKPSSNSQRNELPSGQIYSDEPLDVAARRLNKQITGLEFECVDQVLTTSRFVNAKTEAGAGYMEVSVGHSVFIGEDEFDSVAAYTANHFFWAPVKDLPALAGKNEELFDKALAQLKHRIRHEPISFSLLPKKFTLLQLQDLYEAVLAVKFDKPNFRRKVMSLNIITSCNEKEQNVSHRAANLYTYDMNSYAALLNSGANFQL